MYALPMKCTDVFYIFTCAQTLAINLKRELVCGEEHIKTSFEVGDLHNAQQKLIQFR